MALCTRKFCPITADLPTVQRGTIEWGKERAKKSLQVLNDNLIGPDQPYLCGERITIADYLAVGLLTLGEVVRCNFSAYPNVERWLGNMKQLPNWGKINEEFYGFVDSVKDQPFDAI